MLPKRQEGTYGKTHHVKPTPDEKDADEGMLEEQPRKQAARAQYRKRHSYKTS